MSWEPFFSSAVADFRAGRLEDALAGFNKARESDGHDVYLIYDSRAAIYERLGKHKDALLDAKKTINLAPDRWQGYARAAQLFYRVLKFKSSLTMINMAMDRLKPEDSKRRVELSELTEKVLEAEQKGLILARRMRNHSNMVPVEILSLVFKIIVSENHTELIPLLHVCKRWRNIAWADTSLWDTLVVTSVRQLDKIKFWVERSKGKIRELCMREGVNWNHRWKPDFLRDINWDHLRVFRSEGWDLHPYLMAIGKVDALSNIERLEVELRSSSFFHQKPLVELTSLRSLTFNNCQWSWEKLSLHVQNLTTFIAREAFAVSSIVPFFDANPLLETLVLESTSTDIILFQIDKPMTLPHLAKLELIKANAMEFLTNVSMPSLRLLHIERTALSLNEGLTSLALSGPLQLTNITIRKCYITSTSLLQILRATPLLETLQLPHVDSDMNTVLEALASPLQTNSLSNDPRRSDLFICPSLINLDFSHCPDIKTGPLVRLIKSRLPPQEADTSVKVDKVARILSLHVDGCPLVDADWLPWFRENLQYFSCVYMTRLQARRRR